MHESAFFKPYLCCIFNQCLFFWIQDFSQHGQMHYFCLSIKISLNLHNFTGFGLEKTKKYPRNENTVSQVMENAPNTKKITETCLEQNFSQRLILF